VIARSAVVVFRAAGRGQDAGALARAVNVHGQAAALLEALQPTIRKPAGHGDLPCPSAILGALGTHTRIPPRVGERSR
jgi:hypothetical protein